MSAFAVNINLLGFHGASLCNITTNGQQRPYVMIPLDENEVKVRRLIQSKDEESVQAIARCTIFPYSDAYLKAAAEARRKRGEKPNPSTLPTHEMSLSHSDRFIQQSAARIDIVAAALASYHTEPTAAVVNQDPMDKQSTLFRALRRWLNARIGQVFILQSKYPKPIPQSLTPLDPSSISPFDPSSCNLDDLPY